MIAMSKESRDVLRQTCLNSDLRIQIEQLGNSREFYLQSKYVSSSLGGHVWTAKDDGSVWMNLGDGR
eukprot:1147446-Karenia_brevis.AAC.1